MNHLFIEARRLVAAESSRHEGDLKELSLRIHSNPELCYQESQAHDWICAFVESHGFSVTRHAYGVDTSFMVETGSGSNLVIFCAEYDALPEIGHACGHNLIALSSIAAFVTAAKVLTALGVDGRFRLVGTPAEEGGGGKVKLITAGAFEGAVAALMSHPIGSNSPNEAENFAGYSGIKLNAASRLSVEFQGKPAHAGKNPWMGINALDAAVGSYTSISMLRQQLEPDSRVHGIITEGGTAPNIIPYRTSMAYAVRSSTLAQTEALMAKVQDCFKAAAIASGCTARQETLMSYSDFVPNPSLCQVNTEEMALLGDEYVILAKESSTGSTDMGNVSHVLPSLHPLYVIPTGGAMNHTPEFTATACTPEALDIALRVGKGLAMVGLRLLIDGDLRQEVAKDFKASMPEV